MDGTDTPLDHASWLSPIEYFRELLLRLDAGVFGVASPICVVTSDISHLPQPDSAVMYFTARIILEQQNLRFTAKPALPAHDFFLLIPTVLTAEVQRVRSEYAHFESWGVCDLLTEMALRRVWEKFQCRREVLMAIGYITNLPAILPDAVAQCARIPNVTAQAVTTAIDAALTQCEHLSKLPGTWTRTQRRQRVRLAAESQAVVDLACKHFAHNEPAAIDFLKSLMQRTEPETLRGVG